MQWPWQHLGCLCGCGSSRAGGMVVCSGTERCQPVLGFLGTIPPSWWTLLLITLLTRDPPAAPAGAVRLCRRNYGAWQAPVPRDWQCLPSLMDMQRRGKGRGGSRRALGTLGMVAVLLWCPRGELATGCGGVSWPCCGCRQLLPRCPGTGCRGGVKASGGRPSPPPGRCLPGTG